MGNDSGVEIGSERVEGHDVGGCCRKTILLFACLGLLLVVVMVVVL